MHLRLWRRFSYRDHTLFVVRRPSTVVVNSFIFSISSLNYWTEFNETWHKVSYYYPLPNFCFLADRKNKIAALASDWMRHLRLFLLNRWTEFNETWQEGRPQRPLPSFCLSGWSEKQDGRADLWLDETFSTSPLKLPNRFQWILTGRKIAKSSTKFVFVGPKRNNKIAVTYFFTLKVTVTLMVGLA